MNALNLLFTPKTGPVQQNKPLALHVGSSVLFFGFFFWFFNSSPSDAVWSLLSYTSSLTIALPRGVAELSNQRRVIDTVAETTARVSFYGAGESIPAGTACVQGLTQAKLGVLSF